MSIQEYVEEVVLDIVATAVDKVEEVLEPYVVRQCDDNGEPEPTAQAAAGEAAVQPVEEQVILLSLRLCYTGPVRFGMSRRLAYLSDSFIASECWVCFTLHRVSFKSQWLAFCITPRYSEALVCA